MPVDGRPGNAGALGDGFDGDGVRATDVAATLDPTQGKLVEDGIAGAAQVAQSLGPNGQPVITAARQALVDAWAGSMWVGAAIALFAAAAVIVLSLGKKGRADMATDAVLGDEPTGLPGEHDADGTDVTDREPALAGVGAG